MSNSIPTAAEVSRRAERARLRSALWDQTFRALYGPPTGEIPGGAIEESGDTELPERLTRARLIARPHAMRKLLGPIVVCPGITLPENDLEFRELCVAAMRDNGVWESAKALEALKAWACEQKLSPTRESIAPQLRALARLLAPESLLVIEPARISQRHGVATSSRRAYFCMPFEALKPRLNPENWLEMGPFFEEVNAYEKRDPERTDGWDGIFEELFVIDWGPFRMSRFHTFLKVDYTFDRDRARTDYSLMYEEDNQLEEDRGYLEARRIPDRPGWCEYYAEKSVRMQSPLANMLGPMLNAVFLESGLSAIEEAAIGSWFFKKD